MQIKTRFHYAAIRMAKTLNTPNAGEDTEQQELSLTAGWNTKCCGYFGRLCGSFLQN